MGAKGLQGVVVSVLGGDERELALVRELARLGAALRAVGYPRSGLPHGATRCEEATEAARGAQIVLAPMSNTDADGFIRARLDDGEPIPVDRQLFARLAPSTPFYIGQAKRIVRARAEERGVRLVELGKIEEVAVRNAIPTAEGAIQFAMERLPVTLHGARAFVVGFGRCGQALAVRLHALGAEVTVVARSAVQRGLASGFNLRAASFEALLRPVHAAHVVFNTVPSLVLGAQQLRALSRGALVIDLASAPGGTDFEAAERLGIEAILALGLPGKVAPQTAGAILADAVPAHMMQAIGR